mgnify:FL=1
METFDYIIVGAGTAGCLLANRLSTDPRTTVLLLEAGGKDNYHWIHIPVGYLYTLGNPRTDWCYKTESEPGLNDRSIDYARGKVLGGCSSINGMIYMRGQARDYDQWRQMGNMGWAWDDVLPYFRITENHFAGSNDMHGIDGEWRVEEPRVNWEILAAFREAAAQVGIPKSDDFNRGDNEGCGYFQVNQKRGMRWSAAKAFLRPAMQRQNLEVLTHAQATRIIIEDGRATGLEFSHNETLTEARANGAEILSGGSVNSPQLLELSGIGQGELLQHHGISVQKELAGVGENLQDHLQVRLVYRVSNTRTLNLRANNLLGRIAMGMEYVLFKTGPLTMAPSQLGAFAKSDPSRETANLQYHVQPLSTDKLGEDLHPFEAFTASVCNLRPDSRGSIHIDSSDAMRQPSIRPNYLSTESDRRVTADAIRLTRKICAAPGLEPYNPVEFRPGPEIGHDDESLAKAAGNIATTIFHPVSTCRMGQDDRSVVDDRLRVHGINSLRVVDASIMPTITSGNTNSPVVMIAEKAAEMIIQDGRQNG